MDPFLGQIALFGFNFVPSGWAPCDGRSLTINALTSALYSLLGTAYGGDGFSKFNLPNLGGFILVGANTNTVGSKQGSASVTLDAQTLATHNHNLLATTQTGNVATAAGNVFAATGATIKNGPTKIALKRYSTNTVTTSLNQGSIASTGRGQAHNNMQPYVVLNYCIALQGIYPNRP